MTYLLQATLYDIRRLIIGYIMSRQCIPTKSLHTYVDNTCGLTPLESKIGQSRVDMTLTLNIPYYAMQLELRRLEPKDMHGLPCFA